ncbi:MAG: hypothetical protein Q8R35_02045 [bacterium]|nr:hypothetical protein [bacterium]
MANPVIDLRKLKNELKRRIAPENELPTVSLPNLPPPAEQPLLETDAAMYPAESDSTAPLPPAIIDWEAPEFDPDAAGSALQLLAGALLIIGGIAAAFFKNFLFALLLVISGGLIIGHAFRIPREIRFALTGRGIRVGNRLYEYESLESFWIFYDPPLFKELSLRSRRTVMPDVRVPLGELDPLQLRKILLRFLREEEQQLSLVDIVAKRMGF